MPSRTPSLAARTTRRAPHSPRATTRGTPCRSAGVGVGDTASPFAFAAPDTAMRGHSASIVRRSSSCAATRIGRADEEKGRAATRAATDAADETDETDAAARRRTPARTVHPPEILVTHQRRLPEERSVSAGHAAEFGGPVIRRSGHPRVRNGLGKLTPPGPSVFPGPPGPPDPRTERLDLRLAEELREQLDERR